MKITEDETSVINRIRRRFNNKPIWYRFRIIMKVKIYCYLMLIEYYVTKKLKKNNKT